MLNKKLKMTATVLNILQVIPIVILEIFLFMILTYNNNVALNYIPVRLIVAVEIAIVLWMLIPFFIKKNKVGAIVSIVMSAIMIVMSVGADIAIGLNQKTIKGIFKESEKTIDKIVEKTKERVSENKKVNSLDRLKYKILNIDVKFNYPFKKALSSDDIAIIAEVKKASPSKGLIAENFDYVNIAKEYEAAGASAISVLTEPYFFQGSDDYLKKIAKNVKIPVLRKDFVVDEYMIYEAKLLGASAVLLIAAILSDEQLEQYLTITRVLGMSAIVEAHDENEIKRAIDAGADIVGVNNRNLKDFSVDIENSIRLRRCVDEDIIFISESGIKTKEDIARLKENNVDAVLIGETLMKSPDKKVMIRELKNG